MIQIHTSGPKQPQVHVLGDFAGQAAQMVADAILKSIAHHGRCRIGLAGGEAAGAIYSQLAQLLPAHAYAQLFVTWTDEPVLPEVGQKPGDWQPFAPTSNLRTAYAAWLSKVAIPHENVLPLSLSGDARTELRRFGQEFQSRFDGGLDIALLDCGDDGRIAALFPDHPALDVDDVALAVHDCPEPPTVRISLTIPVLKRAETLIVLARGQAKADVLDRAVRADATLPVSRLLDRPRLYLLLDAPAAQKLVARALDTMTPT